MIFQESLMLSHGLEASRIYYSDLALLYYERFNMAGTRT